MANWFDIAMNLPDVRQQISEANAPNAAGRISKNPQAEIQRLLDEMEKARQGLQRISPDVTPQDVELQQKIQAATLNPALAQVRSRFGARGMSGSAQETIKQSLLAGQVGLQSQQIMNQQAQESAYNRANFEVGRNRQLFESLIGSVSATRSTAPVAKVKKGNRILGAIGGVAGYALGGPIGSQIGASLGGYLGGGQAPTPSAPEPSIYQSPYENVG
jgi:hypothetical protein